MLGLACNSWIPRENALGLYEVLGPESVWSTDQLACPAATSISNRIDTQIFSASYLQQPTPPDSAVFFPQPPPQHHPSVCEEATLDRVWETVIPHTVYTMPPPECHPTRKPTARLLSKRVSASGIHAQSVPPRSQRTPYSLGPAVTRRGNLSTPLYQCQWFDGAMTCSEIVTGTRSAIAQHLQVAHAIRLKADKTVQVCLWENCQKVMRGESIARHILAVHMRDKVPCSSCGLRFARADSMQRHRRTCHAAEGE